MDISPYKLADDLFWAQPGRGGDALAREPVGEFHGVLVDAPARVDVSRRQTLPIGIYHHGTIRELAATRLPRLGAIVMVEPLHNRLFAAACAGLEQDDDLDDEPVRDTASLPAGDMSTTYEADLRELLPIPWRATRGLLTVLLRDQASNRVAIEFVASDPTDPGTADDAESGPSGPKVGGGASMGTQLPSAPGIVLSPPRVVDLAREPRWPLRGAFRVPLAPGAPRVIHLVVTGADNGSVDLLSIEPEDARLEGDDWVGTFELDLFPRFGLRAIQTYFFTAFSGVCMSAPTPSALVSWVRPVQGRA